MRRATRLICVFLLGLIGRPAPAAPASPACLPELDGADTRLAPEQAPEQAHITQIIDGDTLVLAGGAQVRLTGIQAPKLPLGRAGMKAWPLAAEAKSAVSKMALGRDVVLFGLGRDSDRHGRRLAQILVADVASGQSRSDWLQGEMVRQGFARVYTFRDNRACAVALYAREREARAARRGMWRLDFYDIRSAEDDLGRDLGTFQLVEGTVHRVVRGKGDAYLDFGDDYKSDFSVIILARNLRLFDDEGYDLRGLQGRQVRVRGWLAKRNGPLIEVTHPEQIERLADDAPVAR